MLYPLSYEGGPAGSLPPWSSPTPPCWSWLCLSGRVVGAAERDQFPDDRSAQSVYDLCEVFAVVVLNREIGHTVGVALRDEGIGDAPR